MIVTDSGRECPPEVLYAFYFTKLFGVSSFSSVFFKPKLPATWKIITPSGLRNPGAATLPLVRRLSMVALIVSASSSKQRPSTGTTWQHEGRTASSDQRNVLKRENLRTLRSYLRPMPAPHHSPKWRPGPSLIISSLFCLTHAAKPKLSSPGTIQRLRLPGQDLAIVGDADLCIGAINLFSDDHFTGITRHFRKFLKFVKIIHH